MNKPKICPWCKLRNYSAKNGAVCCQACHSIAKRTLAKRSPSQEETIEILNKLSKCPASTITEESTKSQRLRSYGSRVCHVPGDIMLVSDVHADYHDPITIHRLIQVATIYDIRTLVIVGDLFDFDSISSHRKSGPNTKSATDSILSGMSLLANLAGWFTRILVVKGNHDDRLQRMIEAAIEGRSTFASLLATWSSEDLESLDYDQRYLSILQYFSRGSEDSGLPDISDVVEFSAATSVTFDGPPGLKPYRAWHQKSGSIRPPYEMKKLYDRHQQPTIGTHSHLFGVVIAPNGLDPIIQLGCTTDEDWHHYPHNPDSGYPRWVRNFARVQRGVITLYPDNPYLTDWPMIESAYKERVRELRNQIN